MRYPVAVAASFLTTCVLCVLVAPATQSARAADPVPGSATIDQLLEKIADLRRQKADLEKQEQAAAAELKVRLKELVEKLSKLGLADPLPAPPAPPAPVPPKPPEPPADPLAAKLKTAFDSDTADAAVKRERAKDLAALYRQAAALASNVDVATSGDLLKRVRDAAGVLVGADSLKGVRQAVGAELARLLPTDSPLSDEQRKAVGELFVRLAGILEDVAK
jgi:hypothetical protein